MWADLCSNLIDLSSLLEGDDACFDLFCSYVHTLIGPILSQVGWTKVDGEDHTTSLLRAKIIGVAIKFKHQPTIDTAIKKFAAFYGAGALQPATAGAAESGASLSPDLRGSVYGAVVARGGEFGYEAIQQLGASSSLSEEQVRCLNALGCSSDRRLLLRTLDSCISPSVRTQDGPTLMTVIASNRHGSALAWAFTMENWPAILKKYQQSSSLSRIVGQVGNFTSRVHKAQVEEFFQTHAHPGAERAVKQAIERSHTTHDTK